MATGIHQGLLIPPIGLQGFRDPGATPLRATSEASISLQRLRGCSKHRTSTAAVCNPFRLHIQALDFSNRQILALQGM